jgi:hypothetical protein
MKWTCALLALISATGVYAGRDMPTEVTFMGLDSGTVMAMSGPRFGESYPCSNWYNSGSIANKWCHGVIAKATKSVLEEEGVGAVASHVGGLAVLALWETTNKRFDLSDIITAPIELPVNETTKAAVSVDLSGGLILYLSIDF